MSGMIQFNEENPEFVRLSGLMADELMAEVRRYLTMSLEGLLGAATCVRLLMKQGADLSDLRDAPLMAHVLKIAYGQMLPGIVLRFAHKPKLISLIGALPIPQQEELARGDGVLVAELSPDGSINHRMLPPADLSREQLSLVFGRDGLRSESAQEVILKQRRDAAPETTVHVGPHRVDPDRGVYVGSRLIRWAEIDEAQKYRAGNPPRRGRQ